MIRVQAKSKSSHKEGSRLKNLLGFLKWVSGRQYLNPVIIEGQR